MTPPNGYIVSFFNPSRGIKYYAMNALGEGGFGHVWQGVADGGVPIAIKVVKPTSNPLRDLISWYNEQSICLKCLTHPHIITTYDQFACDGSLIIVMEKADGNLEHYLASYGKLCPIVVASIGIQMCFALEHIHKLGVIHRDITMRNVLSFPSGLFKLADFGISKQTVSAEEFARTFIGMKNAVPPELLNLGYSTYQSDIYQLGLVLLTCLTGTEPIPGSASVSDTCRMITDGTPRKLAESLVPEYGGLAEILSIMLRRRDRWRYQNVDEVRQDLIKEWDVTHGR